MPNPKIIDEIIEKKTNPNTIADKIIKQKSLLKPVFDGMQAQPARIKYPCCKIIRIISEKKPQILYPKIDFFIDLLDHEKNIMRWEGIHVIGNLAAVDTENKIEKIFDKFFAPIPGPTLITAANIIAAAAKIATAQPQLTDKITTEILKVEKAKYKTPECRNVALGQTIDAFDQFFNQIKDPKPVVKLIKKQLKNTRNSTKTKAEKFLKKHQLN